MMPRIVRTAIPVIRASRRDLPKGGAVSDGPVYVLRYRCDGSAGFRWTLRGLKPDGSFHGTLQLYQSQSECVAGCSMQGRIPQDRIDLLQKLLQTIDCRPAARQQALLPEPHFATIFRRQTGSTGKASVRLLNYQPNDELRCPRAAAFVQLCQLIDQQLPPFQQPLLQAKSS